MVKIKYAFAVVVTLFASGVFVTGAAQADQAAIQDAQKAVDAAPDDAKLRFALGNVHVQEAMTCLSLEGSRDSACPGRMHRSSAQALEAFLQAYDRGDRSDELAQFFLQSVSLLFMNNMEPDDGARALAMKVLETSRALEDVSSSEKAIMERRMMRPGIALSLAMATRDDTERAALFDEVHAALVKARVDASADELADTLFIQGLALLEEGVRSNDPALRKKRFDDADAIFGKLLKQGEGADASEQALAEQQSGTLSRIGLVWWARLKLGMAADAPTVAERDALLLAAEEILDQSGFSNPLMQAEIAAVRGSAAEAVRHLQYIRGTTTAMKWADFAKSVKQDKYFASLLETPEFAAFLLETEQGK